MKARILPREEWSKLEVNGLVSILPDFRPEDVFPVVVEEGEEIVATGMAVRIVLFDSIWLKDGNAGAARLLMEALWAIGKQFGKLALGQSSKENVTKLLSKRWRRLDVETYVIPLQETQT